MEIVNFYPKFPTLSSFDELNPYFGQSFDDVIVTKKEFADLKLSKHEILSEEAGAQYNHQKYISRFLASLTGYDELLLFHEMGTGKTCTAVATIEKLRNDPTNQFIKGAIICARGTGLLKNFIQETLFVCTDGRYVPENYETLSEREKAHRVRKNLSVFYQFYTFETFAKELSQLTNEQIRKQFENHVFVFDEVHNLREKMEHDLDPDIDEPDLMAIKGQGGRAIGLNIYAEIHRLCHVLKRRKILLMSGTPMKDGPEEFASVLNLILPENSQLETEKAFLKTYFHDNGDFRTENIDRLKSVVTGRISYLKAATTNVMKRFQGSTIGNLRHFIVAIDRMSLFQSNSYANAYERDAKVKSIYNNARQASLFVFPDGSVGSEGFNKYIKKRVNQFGGTEKQKKKRPEYFADAELSFVISSLDRLANCSSKYAAIVESLLADPKDKAFVYCQFVNGSGAIVFSKILDHFGYHQAKGDEKTKAKRYVLATNQTSSAKGIQKAINRFNDADNIDGEYIQVVIGSRVITEGFTLKNVRKEFITTPHWNYSETSQAIARGWRTGSHAEMIARGDKNIEVKVFQCVSLPRPGFLTPSIDLEMYETSETKDLIIKRIERIVKESAFDCPLTVDRNFVAGYDGQRECDYASCDYVCAGKIGSNLDTSTYNLNIEIQRRIVEIVKIRLREIFKTIFFISLKQTFEMFSELNDFELLNALKTLIDTDEIFFNKYGFPNFLRIQGEILFITSDPKTALLSAPGDVPLSDYYTKNLVIENGDTFDQILDVMYFNALPNKIQSLFEFPEHTKDLIVELPPDVQRTILEGCLIAKDSKATKNVQVREIILDFFKGFYDKLDYNGENTWVIWLYYEEIGTVCLNQQTGQFEQCDMPEQKRQQRKTELKSSPIGYYGLYNPKLKDFCLRDVQSSKTTDLRRLNVGRRCINFEHVTLVDIVARKMKIPPPDTFFANVSTQELTRRTQALKNVQQEDFESDNSMKRVLYWAIQKRQFICSKMKEWFEENDLLEENFDCGHQKKRRAKFA